MKAVIREAFHLRLIIFALEPLISPSHLFSRCYIAQLAKMATGNRQIPVVDIKDINSNPDLSQCPQVEEINSAFTSVGFVFIKNHGIDRKLVSGGGPN